MSKLTNTGKNIMSLMEVITERVIIDFIVFIDCLYQFSRTFYSIFWDAWEFAALPPEYECVSDWVNVASVVKRLKII